MATWPNAAIATLMETCGEAVSNAAWNAILNIVFPCPTYLVAPEQRLDSSRPDLTVYIVGENGVFFPFEGKPAKFSWEKLGGEVLGYCIAARPDAFQGYNYGMGGNGPECIICEYDGANMRYLYIHEGELCQSDKMHVLHIFRDAAEILNVLEFVRGAHV
ncbi:hypothetical protein DRE_06736 [Drechslerella stenobrocha 248]|uniref:Uncharacterized protein n=1 Tax=Drechslerella stenobrocha 248 TaxID=1043628 RepID=W7HX38_9PEZI|nr:hypothetical protein DRE_06736 [Drechslerella stenobrocha 248]